MIFARYTAGRLALCCVLLLFLLAAGLFAETSSELEFDETVMLGVYEVVDGELVLAPMERSAHAIPQNTQAAHLMLWDLVKAVVPADMLEKHIVEFVVSTDGIDNILASVLSLDDYHNNDFSFEIDIIDSLDDGGRIRNLEELRSTIIHESAHILTLNDSQIEILELDQYSDNKSYVADEGQTYVNSYLNLFVREFWNSKSIAAARDRFEWEDVLAAEDEVAAIYEANANSYVSEYAATSPEEDIAESWSFFVLDPRPTGQRIADKKVAFFYAFPELVQMRAEIRANLGLR